MIYFYRMYKCEHKIICNWFIESHVLDSYITFWNWYKLKLWKSLQYIHADSWYQWLHNIVTTLKDR